MNVGTGLRANKLKRSKAARTRIGLNTKVSAATRAINAVVTAVPGKRGEFGRKKLSFLVGIWAGNAL